MEKVSSHAEKNRISFTFLFVFELVSGALNNSIQDRGVRNIGQKKWAVAMPCRICLSGMLDFYEVRHIERRGQTDMRETD